VEKVELQGEVLALILRHELSVEGVNFFTTSDNPIQVGILQHRQGTEIKPHIHRDSTRTIKSVQEVLHIEYGKVEANFYNQRGGKIGSSILNTGDTILLLSGGHGFRILEEAKILEIKQGPYYGVKEDKECLDVT
jgi:hypothetical protein